MEKKELKIEQNRNKQNTFIINYELPVERTSKDFKIFYEHLKDSNSDLLIPKLQNKQYENWLYKLHNYNSIQDIPNQELIDFYSNEKYIIQGKDKNIFYYVNKYAKKIESVIQNTLEDQMVGIYYDDKNEKQLFECEKQYKDIHTQMNFVKVQYEKFKNQKKFLNEKIIDLQKDSKYIVNDNSVFIEDTSEKSFIARFQYNELELENLIEVVQEVLRFFDRKNELYEVQRKMKNQILKSHKTHVDDQTINNPQQILKILQQKISNYNQRLVNYLTTIQKFDVINQNFQKIVKKMIWIYQKVLSQNKNLDIVPNQISMY